MAPRKARRDDTRTYCLPCSKDSPRLVRRERVLTGAEKSKADKRKQRRKPAKRKLLNIRFHCGWEGATTVGIRAWRHPPMINVCLSKRRRKSRIEDTLITIYDHGMDVHHAKAAVVVALTRWGLRAFKGMSWSSPKGKGMLREHIKRIANTQQKVFINSLAGLEDEVAEAIMRDDAEDYIAGVVGVRS